MKRKRLKITAINTLPTECHTSPVGIVASVPGSWIGLGLKLFIVDDSNERLVSQLSFSYTIFCCLFIPVFARFYLV